MKLVVGLGNPGRKYAETRHNVGWMVLAELKRNYGSGQPKEKFHGEVVEAEIAGEQVLLLAPHTFMNESGRSVLAARDFYKLADDALLVICDDFQFAFEQVTGAARGGFGRPERAGRYCAPVGERSGSPVTTRYRACSRKLGPRRICVG